MAAVDAQFYWMSAKVPNDQFLLYAFDGEPTDLERAVAQVYRRARGCPGLGMRVQDRGALAYPQWVPTPVQRDQLVCHDLADRSWQGCLAAVVGLASKQLDMRRMPWRLHVFTPVHDVPGVSGLGTVAVMQFAHALGDGARGFGDGRVAVRPAGRGSRNSQVACGFPAVAGRPCGPRSSPTGS